HQNNCTSFECLYVGKTRQCQNSVDEFTPPSAWFGYLWQNTCLHHKTQSGLIATDCRCNTSYCNQHLAEKAEDIALNDTMRTRPLIKCHFSFDIEGIASDKFFCVGELCALSEEKGVRTCVNITKFENAEPIRKLGLIDFDNRTYYLCDKELCNWNGSIALSSLTGPWKPKDNSTLVLYQGNSASYFSLLFSALAVVIL
ncbi:hypothetical protein PMAYCL1PPCAC_25103, partial [Pristionchus mayeri]